MIKNKLKDWLNIKNWKPIFFVKLKKNIHYVSLNKLFSSGIMKDQFSRCWVFSCLWESLFLSSFLDIVTKRFFFWVFSLTTGRCSHFGRIYFLINYAKMVYFWRTFTKFMSEKKAWDFISPAPFLPSLFSGFLINSFKLIIRGSYLFYDWDRLRGKISRKS